MHYQFGKLVWIWMQEGMLVTCRGRKGIFKHSTNSWHEYDNWFSLSRCVVLLLVMGTWQYCTFLSSLVQSICVSIALLACHMGEHNGSSWLGGAREVPLWLYGGITHFSRLELTALPHWRSVQYYLTIRWKCGTYVLSFTEIISGLQ